jgi:hypothetical protein
MTQPDFVKPDPPIKSTPLPETGNAPAVTLIAKATIVAGLVLVLSAWVKSIRGQNYDSHLMMGAGTVATGITWWILGVILKSIERK